MRWWLIIVAILLSVPLWGQVPTLRLSDIDSGPATGNSDPTFFTANVDGAYVTVWGQNLGNTQSTSTITFGGNAANVVYWGPATCLDTTHCYSPANLGVPTSGLSNKGAWNSGTSYVVNDEVTYQSVTFVAIQSNSNVAPNVDPTNWLAIDPFHKAQVIIAEVPHAASGSSPIQVTVNSVASNTLPFTVRSGTIYFAGTGGNDSTGTGSWASKWLSLFKCKNAIGSGGICYALIGSDLTQRLGGDCVAHGVQLYIDRSGTSGNPYSLVGYPGNQVTVGDDSVNCDQIEWHNSTLGTCSGSSVGGSLPTGQCDTHYWTIAKLVFTGSTTTPGGNIMAITGNDRIVGNRVYSPNAPCTSNVGFLSIRGDAIVFDGNEVGPTCTTTTTSGSLDHTLYVSGFRTTGALTGFPGCQNTADPDNLLICENYAGTGTQTGTIQDPVGRDISFNFFHDNNENTGIQVYNHQDNANCTETNPTGVSHGCSYPVSNHTITHNVIVNQAGDGIKLGSSVIGNNTVANNYILHAGIKFNDIVNFSCLNLLGGDGAVVTTGVSTSSPHVYNNTLQTCGDPSTVGTPSFTRGCITTGLSNGAAQWLPDIHNNACDQTIYGYEYAWVSASVCCGGSPPTWTTNSPQWSTQSYFGCTQASCKLATWDSSTQTSAPMIGASGIPLSGSPLINNGVTESLASPDLAAVNRPVSPSTNYAIGAYEYQPSGSTTGGTIVSGIATLSGKATIQ